jgi:hypothetical protein
MLEQVKLLLGIANSDKTKDSLLNTIIDMCSDEAIAYCNLLEFDDKMERIIVKMAIQSYNRLGSEGVASQSFSGVNESFIEGYSLDIIKALNRFRKIVLV